MIEEELEPEEDEGGDDDWEQVTKEEANEEKEVLTPSGARMTILDGGLQ